MFLLLEAIDVGGGTIAMIESLARFNNMTQEVEKEKKMSVRPYMIMPYFGAILLVSTTLMTLLFTTNTIAMGGEAVASAADTSFLSLIFTVSVITHCYLIGLVCGKISEESLAAGFKHAALLVLIAIVASKVVPALLA
jgi:flagellar protein FlaJ